MVEHEVVRAVPIEIHWRHLFDAFEGVAERQSVGKAEVERAGRRHHGGTMPLLEGPGLRHAGWAVIDEVLQLRPQGNGPRKRQIVRKEAAPVALSHRRHGAAAAKVREAEIGLFENLGQVRVSGEVTPCLQTLRGGLEGLGHFARAGRTRHREGKHATVGDGRNVERGVLF